MTFTKNVPQSIQIARTPMGFTEVLFRRRGETRRAECESECAGGLKGSSETRSGGNLVPIQTGECPDGSKRSAAAGAEADREMQLPIAGAGNFKRGGKIIRSRSTCILIITPAFFSSFFCLLAAACENPFYRPLKCSCYGQNCQKYVRLHD